MTQQWLDPAVLQRALVAAGYHPGPVDGVWGRRSIRALRDYQRDHGLTPDGIAGPLTLARLLPQWQSSVAASAAAVAAGMPWYQEAQRLRGTLEQPGQASNPVILDWAKQADIPYSGDDVAWCGLFVAHCIGATLPDEPLPSRPLSARAWTGWGRQVTPGLGAVLVFWRGVRAGWQGHVGFYAGEDGSAFSVLGGNQSDRVSMARISRERLLGAYWPTTAPSAVQLIQAAPATGALSQNEA